MAFSLHERRLPSVAGIPETVIAAVSGAAVAQSVLSLVRDYWAKRPRITTRRGRDSVEINLDDPEDAKQFIDELLVRRDVGENGPLPK